MKSIFSTVTLCALTLGVAPAAAQTTPDVPFSQSDREVAINTLIRRIDHYVGSDRKAAIVDRLTSRRAHYEAITDAETFRTVVNADLLETSGDRHLALWIERPNTTMDVGASAAVGLGFQVSLMADGVAYLDLDVFSGEPAAADALDAALASVASAPALIVDVRDNGGGGQAVLYRLLGHLLGGRTELGSIRWRECAPPPPAAPDRCVHVAPRVERRFSDAVAAPLFVGKPVYVLTSNESFSAAEALAFELKRAGRAVIVGETTKGGANPSGMMDAGARFSVVMPLGETVFADGRASWEGVGVRPDVFVPAGDALATAGILASKPGAMSFRALDGLTQTLGLGANPGVARPR